jgi:hypothetical protein
MKWTPSVEYVNGDKFPWKAYGVKGNKRELVAQLAEKQYHHGFLLNYGFSDKLLKKAIDAFYKSSKLSRKSFSGQISAKSLAEEFCNVANGQTWKMPDKL